MVGPDGAAAALRMRAMRSGVSGREKRRRKAQKIGPEEQVERSRATLRVNEPEADAELPVTAFGSPRRY